MFCLSVIGFRPVFAEEMFPEQRGLHRLRCGIDAQRFARELRDEFQDAGIVDGVGNILAPRERAVASNEHGGMLQWIKFQFVECLDDGLAGVKFVIDFDFGGLEFWCTPPICGKAG